jgi:iron(III) transport system substrate-binding protein
MSTLCFQSAASRVYEEYRLMKGRSSARSIAAGLVIALFAVGTAFAQNPSSSQAALYELAKKEGSFVLWSPIDAPALKQIADVFTARYPGVVMKHFDIQPGPAVERIVAESRAGASGVDAVDANIPYFKPLIDRGLLQSVDWQAFGVDHQYVLLDGRAVNHYELEQPITINTQLVKAGDIKAWDDLLNPKWSGKIILEARGGVFAVLSQKWGEEKATQYLSALLKNKPIVIKGGTTALEGLAGGQGAILLGASPTKIEIYKKMGAPVDWLRISPIPVLVYCTAVLKTAIHPNAAKLWVVWLLSSEGQQALYKYHNMGVLSGPVASIRGKEFQGVELIREVLNADEGSRILTKYSSQIGSLD